MFLLLLWIFPIASSYSQDNISKAQDAFHFYKKYTVNDGLSQGMIMSIMQDREGYIWFGTTDGLNRFDGRDFKVFKYNSLDSFSLPDPYVTEIFEDSKERIWLTSKNGVSSLYDKKSGKFFRIIFKSDREFEMSRSTRLVESQNGEVFIITRYYVGRIEDFIPDFNNPNLELKVSEAKDLYIDNSDVQCFDLKFDDDGYNWIAWKNKVYFKKLNDDKSTYEELDLEYKNTPKRGQYWKQFHLFGKQKGEFMWLHDSNGHIYKLKNREVVGSIETGGFNFQIVVDANNVVWGYGFYNPNQRYEEGKKVEGLFIVDEDLQNLVPMDKYPELGINKTWVSRDGQIWLGLNGDGILSVNPLDSPFRFYGRTGRRKSEIDEFPIFGLRTNRINEVLMVSGPILRLDTVNGGWTEHSPWIEKQPDRTDKGRPGDFLEDHKGRVWIGLISGLYRRDPENNEIRHLSEQTGGEGEIALRHTPYLFEDSKNNLYVFNRGSIMNQYFEEKDVFKNYIFGETRPEQLAYVGDVKEDSEGNFWVGSTSGLYFFDSGKEEFNRITSGKGFPGKLSVYGLHVREDDDGLRVWVGTEGRWPLQV